MTTIPRRRILRSAPVAERAERTSPVTFQRHQERLDQERKAFRRWLTRLKRAMHALEKHQTRIDRLEKLAARPRQT